MDLWIITDLKSRRLFGIFESKLSALDAIQMWLVDGKFPELANQVDKMQPFDGETELLRTGEGYLHIGPAALNDGAELMLIERGYR